MMYAMENGKTTDMKNIDKTLGRLKPLYNKLWIYKKQAASVSLNYRPHQPEANFFPA